MLIAYDHANVTLCNYVTCSHRTSHRFLKVTAIHRAHPVTRLLYSIQRYTAIQRYTLYSYIALYTIHAIHHPSVWILHYYCNRVSRCRRYANGAAIPSDDEDQILHGDQEEGILV